MPTSPRVVDEHALDSYSVQYGPIGVTVVVGREGRTGTGTSKRSEHEAEADAVAALEEQFADEVADEDPAPPPWLAHDEPEVQA